MKNEGVLAIRRIWFLACFSGLIYALVFALPFPLWKYYRQVPPVDYAKFTRHNPWAALLFVLGLLTLFYLYAWAISLAKKHKLPKYSPYLGFIPIIPLFLSYPILAIDLFIYALRTRGWAIYGLNPLAVAPANFPAEDPWLGLAGEWANIASPYGPLWELITLLGYYLVGGNFLAHLFFLKSLALLAYGLCIYILGRLLAVLAPNFQIWGMLAFAWNPLVLLETAQNAHNDLLMMLFLLGGIYALVKGQPLWVMPLLALSVLIKFVTILVWPLFLITLILQKAHWKSRLGLFFLHSLIFGSIILLGMQALWPGWENWGLQAMNSGAGRSLLALIILGLREIGWPGQTFTNARLLVNGGWLIILSPYFWQVRGQFKRIETLIYLSWALFFWYLLLVIPVFHAWYVLWVLPLAFLRPKQQKGVQATLVLSLTGLLIIPYFEIVRVWWPLLLENHFLGHLIGVPLLVLPSAFLALRGFKTSA